MGWKFLYCLAFNYPEKVPALEKVHGYVVFFRMLGRILPKTYGSIYQSYILQYPIQKYMGCREDMKQWMYRLEKVMDHHFSIQCKEFNEIEDEIEKYRSGCGNAKGPHKDKMPTCRMKSADTIAKIKQPLRKTRKTRKTRVTRKTRDARKTRVTRKTRTARKTSHSRNSRKHKTM